MFSVSTCHSINLTVQDNGIMKNKYEKQQDNSLLQVNGNTDDKIKSDANDKEFEGCLIGDDSIGSSSSSFWPMTSLASTAPEVSSLNSNSMTSNYDTSTYPQSSNSITYDLRLQGGIPLEGGRSRVETQTKVVLKLCDPITGVPCSNFKRVHVSPNLLFNPYRQLIASHKVKAKKPGRPCKNLKKEPIEDTSSRLPGNLPNQYSCDPSLSGDQLRSPPPPFLYPVARDELLLEAKVISSSDPDKPIIVCNSCGSRELRRLLRKRGGNASGYHSEFVNVSTEPLLYESNVFPNHTREESEILVQRSHRILLVNSPPTIEMSDGLFEIPLRIPCYSRHNQEKKGFLIIISIYDYHRKLIASVTTPPLFVTDDHKSASKLRGRASSTSSVSMPRSNQTAPNGSVSAPATVSSFSLKQAGLICVKSSSKTVRSDKQGSRFRAVFQGSRRSRELFKLTDDDPRLNGVSQNPVISNSAHHLSPLFYPQDNNSPSPIESHGSSTATLCAGRDDGFPGVSTPFWTSCSPSTKDVASSGPPTSTHVHFYVASGKHAESNNANTKSPAGSYFANTAASPYASVVPTPIMIKSGMHSEYASEASNYVNSHNVQFANGVGEAVRTAGTQHLRVSSGDAGYAGHHGHRMTENMTSFLSENNRDSLYHLLHSHNHELRHHLHRNPFTHYSQRHNHPHQSEYMGSGHPYYSGNHHQQQQQQHAGYHCSTTSREYKVSVNSASSESSNMTAAIMDDSGANQLPSPMEKQQAYQMMSHAAENTGGVQKIYKVIPKEGPLAGGSEVSLIGSNFTLATNVYFGSKPAKRVVCYSSTVISCLAPPGDHFGTVPVSCTLGQESAANGAEKGEYTYTLNKDIELYKTALVLMGLEKGGGIQAADVVARQILRRHDPSAVNDCRSSITHQLRQRYNRFCEDHEGSGAKDEEPMVVPSLTGFNIHGRMERILSRVPGFMIYFGFFLVACMMLRTCPYTATVKAYQSNVGGVNMMHRIAKNNK